jgi:hypothetical protein
MQENRPFFEIEEPVFCYEFISPYQEEIANKIITTLTNVGRHPVKYLSAKAFLSNYSETDSIIIINFSTSNSIPNSGVII